MLTVYGLRDRSVVDCCALLMTIMFFASETAVSVVATVGLLLLIIIIINKHVLINEDFKTRTRETELLRLLRRLHM